MLIAIPLMAIGLLLLIFGKGDLQTAGMLCFLAGLGLLIEPSPA